MKRGSKATAKVPGKRPLPALAESSSRQSKKSKRKSDAKEPSAKRMKTTTGPCFFTLPPLAEDVDESTGHEDRMASIFEDDDVVEVLPPAAAFARRSSKPSSDGARERAQAIPARALVKGEGNSSTADDRGWILFFLLISVFLYFLFLSNTAFYSCCGEFW